MTNRKARRPFYALGALFAAALVSACGAAGDSDPRHFEDFDTISQELPKGMSGATNGQGDYCTGGDLCNLGEGDCDRDSECAGTLVCGYDNLINYLPTAKNGMDACTAPHCRSGTQNSDETGVDCGGADCGSCPGCPTAPDGDPNHCTSTCPCPAGEADCDVNADCQGALVCGQNLGAQFGYPAGHSVCVPSHCTNGFQDGYEEAVDCGGPDCGTCAGGSSPATSCQGGDLNICGPADSENCCAAFNVPSGTFIRNYDGVILTDSTNKSATVSAFVLDKYEVTVGRFRKFAEAFDTWVAGGNPAAGAGAHPNVPGSGWDATWPLAASAAELTANLGGAGECTWTASADGNERRAINCLDWYTAFAFCHWDGGRLPTEAEHNRAASGGEQQRVYPWSSPASSTSISKSQAQYGCGSDGCSGDPSEVLWVGSLPTGAGRWGHLDLSGNVYEMTLDVWQSTLPSPCWNCASLVTGSPWHVVRGGSWATSNTDKLTAGARDRAATENRYAHIGFRCVRL